MSRVEDITRFVVSVDVPEPPADWYATAASAARALFSSTVTEATVSCTPLTLERLREAIDQVERMQRIPDWVPPRIDPELTAVTLRLAGLTPGPSPTGVLVTDLLGGEGPYPSEWLMVAPDEMLA